MLVINRLPYRSCFNKEGTVCMYEGYLQQSLATLDYHMTQCLATDSTDMGDVCRLKFINYLKFSNYKISHNTAEKPLSDQL